MGRRHIALSLAAMAAIAAACSSFDAEGPGTVDASTTEAGSGPDAPLPPQGDASIDGGWIPCAQRPDDPYHFCTDFDFEGNVQFKWDGPLVAAGTIDETDAALSPPRALLTRLVAGPPAGKASVYKRRGALVDLNAKQRVKVSFSMRVPKVPYPPGAAGSGYTHFVVLAFDQPSCNTSGTTKQRQIELSFEPNGNVALVAKGLRDLCPDGGNDVKTTIMPFKATDFAGFRRVSFEVARTACDGSAGTSLRADIDGQQMPCIPLSPGDPLTHGADMVLTLGLYAGGALPVQETEVIYDNVTLDVD